MAYTLQWRMNAKQFAAKLPDKPTVMIGRSPDCDITLTDNRISRHHVQLSIAPLVLKNLSSSNPLLCQQGESYEQIATGASCPLSIGQIFVIGGVHLRLVEASDDGNLVICWNCERKLDAEIKDCPWCGVTLAFGEEA